MHWNKFGTFFRELRANVSKLQIFWTRSLFSAAFRRNRKQSCLALPSLSLSLLSSAVAVGVFFPLQHSHKPAPVIVSFAAVLAFVEGTWPAAAVACMYILLLFFLSSSMRVFVQTRTHWETPVGADCCCFVWLQNSHLYLESALHTTPEWRKILSCLFHSSGDDTDKKKIRAGLDDKFLPIPKNNTRSSIQIRPSVRSSRPDVDLVVSRSCFLLQAAAAVAFPLLCWNYFWLQQHRQRAFHIHKTLSQTNERTQQTLGSPEIVSVDYSLSLSHNWHGNSTQSWPGRGRSFFTEDQLALRVNSHFFFVWKSSWKTVPTPRPPAENIIFATVWR